MRWACIPVLLTLLAGCSEQTGARSEGGLRLGSVLSGEVGEFAAADRVVEFDFPADHGAHPEYRSEWWYLTANLSAGGEVRPSEMADYGVQFTLFRQALSPSDDSEPSAWSAQVYLGHLAVTDLRTGRHLFAERFSRAHPALAGWQSETHTVALEGWRVEFAANGLRVEAEDDQIGVMLEMTASKPVLLQGEQGLSRKSAGNASYYYSFPRLEVRGAVRVGETRQEVRGLAWFDHEWSTSVLADGQVGWDWFALHFDDGRDLMAFQLRRSDGRRDAYDHGALSPAVGEPRVLTVEDYALEPIRWWTDDVGVRWPVEWTLTLGDEQLRLAALLDEQKMATMVTYWEGAIAIYGQDGRALGTGYMELTGYGG